MPAFIVVSLSGNQLYVSADPGLANGFTAQTRIMPPGAVDNSQIVDAKVFANILAEAIVALVGPNAKNSTLHFLVEPQDVYVRFISTRKDSGDVSSQIEAEVAAKLEGVNVADLYYSCQKIAPFVFQFVGIKKNAVSAYLEVGSSLGIPVAAVTPWVLLLPKYVNKGAPCVFLARRLDNQIVALSELNGVYFSEAYTEDKSVEELQTLVQKLSVYERSKPIQNVYTLDYEQFSLSSSYVVAELFADEKFAKWPQHKLHVLYESVMAADPNGALFGTQLNLLNLLPVPVGSQKQSSLVYVGATLGVVLSVGALVGGIMMLKNSGRSALEKVQQPQQVLSEATHDATESTQTTQSQQLPELKRDDIRLRVENGAGVAGVAAKSRDELLALGYQVVSIGNAAENRSDTLVRMKADKRVYRDLLFSDLKDKHDVVIEDTLAADAEYDVLVVIGAK